MKNKNDILEELEKEAPFLSRIKKKNNFSTPNNYFEVLPEVITSNNLNNKSLRYSFDRLSYRVLVPILSLFIIAFIIFNFNKNSIESELTNDQLSELIVDEDYFEIDDFLVYETYAEILEEEEIDESSDTEEYINYLLENNIDINSIIEKH